MSTLLRSVAAVVFASLLAGCGAADDDEDVAEAEAALSANDKIAFAYFRGKGLSPVQAAGIVGNLDQESGMNPRIKQYGGGPGRGIAQWSAGGRWDTSRNDNAVGYAKKHGADVYALRTQLDFVWYELKTFPGYGLAPLKKAKDVTTATRVFMREFEVCGACAESKRVAFAKAALKAYGDDVVDPPKPAPAPAPPPPPSPEPPKPKPDAGAAPTTPDAGQDAGPPISTADAGADPSPTPATTPTTEDEPYADPPEGDPSDAEDPEEPSSGSATERASLAGPSAGGCSSSPLSPDDVGAGIAAAVFALSVLSRRRRGMGASR